MKGCGLLWRSNWELISGCRQTLFATDSEIVDVELVGEEETQQTPSRGGANFSGAGVPSQLPRPRVLGQDQVCLSSLLSISENKYFINEIEWE